MKNQQFRRLVTLQTRVTLLSEVYATAGYVHGRTALAILQALMGRGSPEIIPDLGSLHRACIWENIVLKKELLNQGVSATSALTPLAGSDPSVAAASAVAQVAESAGVNDEVIASLSGAPAPTSDSKNDAKDTPRAKNAQALRHVVTQVPAALAPLFQGSLSYYRIFSQAYISFSSCQVVQRECETFAR
jgi:E3 ubiquitin-protein ligase HUWE1